jgi:predicted Rossmann fold nucleotide-binding protein DprA/Smf involved in DNA uptake
MAPARDASSDAVLRVVAREACGADAIAAAVGMDAAAVAMALVALEIDGAVCREPGGVFRAVARRRRV